MILALMQRYLQRETSPDFLFINSAFATPAAKGYVYIEADKEVHVQKAIANLWRLKQWKIRLVPISEMLQSLQIKLDDVTLKPGQWVRMKRGNYKGDLAQVTEVADVNVTVRLIPRLDLAEIKAEADAANNATDDQPVKKRGFPPKKSGSRPLQRMFNEEEIRYDHFILITNNK